jgi:hypothetical protein
MTVVLTVLLALIGVLFVMGARLDKMATSSISENKQLEAAVDSVVEKICQVLNSDVPGQTGAEYYDYPGATDPWLASLEPVKDPNYCWSQISDIYNKLGNGAKDLPAKIIAEYPNAADVGDSPTGRVFPADADGDGVADAVWVRLADISSLPEKAKERPFFTAVRIIDHGAMLNVNTAFDPDPNNSAITVGPPDGSSQMQINLMALSWRPGDTVYNKLKETDLLKDRDPNINPANVPLRILQDYEAGVIWQPEEPYQPYTPFDISDELELRYRFLLNHVDIDTRLEELGTEKDRSWQFRKGAFRTPVDSGELDKWFLSAHDSGTIDPNYAYRHIATTYNFDRIIPPPGKKVINMGALPEVLALYQALYNGISPTEPNRIAIAAQLAVNIIDFTDDDIKNVTSFNNAGVTYYGFEPQPFISEIGLKIHGGQPDVLSHYAVELYNPFNMPIPLAGFTLSVCNQAGTNVADISLDSKTINPNGRLVIADDLTKFTIDAAAATLEDTKLKLADNFKDTNNDTYLDMCDYYNIELKRTIGPTALVIDKQKTINDWFVWKGSTEFGTEKYPQRDDDEWRIVYQDMDVIGTPGSLGKDNSASTNKRGYNLATLERPLRTVGEIALPLRIGHGQGPNSTLGEKIAASAGAEAKVRLDLTNPAFAEIFRYVTVMDPTEYNLAGREMRIKIKGRINVNTAPWFVIAQLPWVRYTATGNTYLRARAIVDGRSTNGPYKSIADLMRVPEMRDLDSDGVNNLNIDTPKGPDFTPDSAQDNNFEERDLIFSRISNLITVRSDVFTAYILVRLGTDGPQKRVMVILDRSGVSLPTDKVKIVAYHPVPDPR